MSQSVVKLFLSALYGLLLSTVTASVLWAQTATSDADKGCPHDGKAFEGTSEEIKYRGCEGSVDGVPYVIYLPQDWKPGGPLLMNMYGYWPTVKDLPLRKIYDLRAPAWLALGYAVAVSQSKRGWVPRQRIKDTERLRQYFLEKFGGRKASYPSVISGSSMGGMQTYHLIETNPHYDGALAMCGFAMPSLAYLQKYVFNTRLLFDFHFPAVHSGSVVEFPDGKDTMKNSCEALRKYIPNGPANLFCSPKPDSAPVFSLNPENVQEYLQMTSTPVVGHIPQKVALDSELLRELYETYGRKNIFDNTNEIYPHRIGNNRLIPRYEAEVKFDQEVEITGKIDKPVLGMHTYVDELVPLETTRYYQELTNSHGTTKNFVQLYTNSVGHCNFKDSELKGALELLDKWIRRSARPQSGDFTDGRGPLPNQRPYR